MTAHRNETNLSDNELHSQVAALKSDLGAVKRDLSSITQALLEQGRDTARSAKDEMERRLHEGVEHGRRYVEQRPLTAALTAFGVGLLAGFLVHRR